MAKEVWSESQFIYNLIKDIFLLPITLILVLAKKKEPIDLFQPFKDLWKFITDARMTFYLILFNIIIFICIRLILYFAGFGFVNDVVTGEGFGSLGRMAHQQADMGLYQFQINNFLMFQEGSLFNHPIFILTFLLAGFSHLNLGHLLGNMLPFFIVGRVVEKKIGAFKLLLIYLVAHIISQFISVLISLFYYGVSGTSMGASLALFGVFAAAIILSPFYLTYITIIPFPLLLLVVPKIAMEFTMIQYEILMGIRTGINHIGHMVGFFAAVGFMVFLYRKNLREIKLGLVFSVIAMILALVLAFGFGIAEFPIPNLISMIMGG